MRRIAILTALLALSTVAPALAVEGINLRWDGCVASGGVSNKTFACNTNTGTESLNASFVLSAPFSNVIGIEGSLDVNPTASLPSWWMFRNAGSCRQNALSLAFSTGIQPAGCLNALDWNGSATGGLASYATVFVSGYPGYTRLQFVIAVPDVDAVTMPAGQEIFAGRFTITHAKTVGTGSCGGCDAPVCVGVHKLKLVRPVGMGDQLLYNETFPSSSTVSWQGANAGSIVDPFTQGNDPGPDRTVTCSAAVPAQNHTWGMIKSQYR